MTTRPGRRPVTETSTSCSMTPIPLRTDPFPPAPRTRVDRVQVRRPSLSQRMAARAVAVAAGVAGSSLVAAMAVIDAARRGRPR